MALLNVAQENARSLRLLEEMAPSKVHLLEGLAQNRSGQLSAEGVVFLVFFSREYDKGRMACDLLSLLCNVEASNPWACMVGNFFSAGTHAEYHLFVYFLLLTEATRHLIVHR